MKILIDMNLSPEWRELFEAHGFEAQHWSQIGNPRAKDREVLAWAREQRFIVFTHDPRRGSLEVYDEVVAILEKLPVNFNKNDVCRLLGSSPDRVALFRALQRLGDEKRIEVVEHGLGRRTTVYRRIDGSGAVSRGG